MSLNKALDKMKKISPIVLSFLFLFSCGNKTSDKISVTPEYIPSNEPYYCSSPLKNPTYDFAKLSGSVRKNDNASLGYSFVSFSKTYHGFTGIIDSNTIIYKDNAIVNKIDSELSTVTAFFSTKSKSDDAKWLKITIAPMAENITYLVIGEIPEDLEKMNVYTGTPLE